MNSAKFEQLVSMLEKPARSGGSCRARCPVHNSKGQTLSVTDKSGGYIVAHCFSCGAGGPDVVKALGLPISILFPDDDYKPPVITKRMREDNILDALTVQFSGKPETLADSRQKIKATERLKGYAIKAEEVGENAPPIDHPALNDFREHYDEALRQSPALRKEIVDSHWEGIAQRAYLWLKNL